jgi:calcineurin-like phosphoesterase family protein
MANVFLVSDTHFGHAGVCRFLRDDGTKLRPWDDPDEMDEAMIERWNAVVRPNDKVYHLGDVVINRKALKTLHRLNGDKVLIKGNHDIFRLEEYTEHFRDIRGYHVLNGMIMSHIPVHEESIARFGVNIHGHLHSNRVMKNGVIDPRYFNVSVEQIDFTPISLEDLKLRVKEQGGLTNFRS